MFGFEGVFTNALKPKGYAPLAQLVEQLTLNQRAPGSSPWWCTTFSPRLICGSLVKRLRLRPLTPTTWVRFPYESPFFTSLYLAGAYCDEVPPVPIPNTEVKLISAEDTWREAAWENRAVPALYYLNLVLQGPLAQLVRATGS